MSMKVLVVDDNELMREGLCVLLARDPDLDVLSAADGATAVQIAIDAAPEVVVMDLSMPGMSGFEATRKIVEARPAAKVIILSAFADDRKVEEALAAGAAGYVLKTQAATDLPDAVRAVLEQRTYVSFRGRVASL
jgi:NarL family two-component system response regulator LiaR